MPTLEFEGKPFVYSHHLSVPYRELIPMPEKGIGEPSLDGNLIIHGDNLEALKALLPRYAGKVDVIYIDPPYNTGNEGWAYNDNVNSPMMKSWLGDKVGIDDAQRHDKWLCMMWPRLNLIWELLSNRGSFWLTLDDNEVHSAKLICDEIFGEESFVSQLVWQKRTSRENRTAISSSHDYILLYAKAGAEEWKGIRRRLGSVGENYSNPDEDIRGDWVSVPFSAQGYRKNQVYKITAPTGDFLEPPRGRCWGATEAVFKSLLADNRIYFPRQGKGRPRVKQFRWEEKGLVPSTLWLASEVGNNESAKKQLLDIFYEGAVFDTPKPAQLIQRIVEIAADENSLILDSFAGSGTTAHAVLEANKGDGGNRKFILVETEGYADKLTAERVRRVIKGVPKAKTEVLREGVGGTFTYCELGEAMDTGRFFNGGGTPAYGQLARYVIYTATGETVEVPDAPLDGWFAAEAGGQRIHVIYEADKEFLRSAKAALTLDRAREIAAAASAAGKSALVFGAAQYVNSKVLKELRITFAQLPWSVHERLNGGSHASAPGASA